VVRWLSKAGEPQPHAQPRDIPPSHWKQGFDAFATQFGMASAAATAMEALLPAFLGLNRATRSPADMANPAGLFTAGPNYAQMFETR
jgi:hypothetical protein